MRTIESLNGLEAYILVGSESMAERIGIVIYKVAGKYGKGLWVGPLECHGILPDKKVEDLRKEVNKAGWNKTDEVMGYEGGNIGDKLWEMVQVIQKMPGMTNIVVIDKEIHMDKKKYAVTVEGGVAGV